MNSRQQALALICLITLIAALPGQNVEKPKRGTITAVDGVPVVYDVRGTGATTLVFLHGWCGDRAAWKNQLDAFAGDYRVVAVDQAGHGESGSDRKIWTVQGLGDDVHTLVTKLGLKRVVLIGHSMGGSVALAAAKRLPGVVVGVVGVDTLHNADHKWPEEMTRNVIAGFENDFKGTLRFGMRGMLPEKADPELFNWLVSRAETRDPKMAVALFRQFPELDMKTLFKEAGVPIRCINAAPETMFAIETAVDTNRKYADYNAVIMKGVGHFPMLEKPAEFNDHLRNVLKEFQRKP